MCTSRTRSVISIEPLIEKYARGISRREKPEKVLDAREPLGQHHSRGIILPIAISDGPRRRFRWGADEEPPKPVVEERPSGATIMDAPTRKMPPPAELAGSPQDLKVMDASGCSSLLEPDVARKGMSFGSWCNSVRETRRVWTAPLEQILQWVGRPIDMIKVDAQGMDLRVARSGGPLLSRVRRFQLEVISDDCSPLYTGQPRCSHVVSTMRGLGFVPVRPTPCTPIFPRDRANHYCEMEILFVQATREPEQAVLDAPFLFYHNIALNGCVGSFPARESGEMQRNPPEGKAVARLGQLQVPGYGRYHGAGFISSQWQGLQFSSMGLPYLCPRLCFKRDCPSASNRDRGEWRRARTCGFRSGADWCVCVPPPSSRQHLATRWTCRKLAPQRRRNSM